MPAMAAKRGADRSSTRERVIQAADRLWGANGVRGASLDDIAREASVTKPTVYYYFTDKSALFTAVVCSVLEEHGAGLKTASHRGGRARERLVSALAYLVGARCSGPRRLRDGGAAQSARPLDRSRSISRWPLRAAARVGPRRPRRRRYRGLGARSLTAAWAEPNTPSRS